MPIGSPAPRDVALRVIREHLPPEWRQRDLPGDLPLGADGVGLDSIAIVELLLACERELGRPLSAGMLVDGRITVATLLADAARAGA